MKARESVIRLLILLFACIFQHLSYAQFQSPHVNAGNNAQVKITNINQFRERLGKKIAIREAYLQPVNGTHWSFVNSNCEPKESCGFYEGVFLKITIQSIWPEPVLLTAGRLEVLGKFSQSSRPFRGGRGVLHEFVTKQDAPNDLLFKPGEIKTLTLSTGIRLNRAMTFFTPTIIESRISCLGDHYVTLDTELIDQLNQFFAKEYGKNAALKITIFEKGYEPIFQTTFLMSRGSDLFSVGNVEKDSYQLQHDALIGEVISMLNKNAVKASRENRVDRCHD